MLSKWPATLCPFFAHTPHQCWHSCIHNCCVKTPPQQVKQRYIVLLHDRLANSFKTPRSRPQYTPGTLCSRHCTASVYTWDTLQQTLHCLSIHLGHSAADTTLPQYTPGTLCSRHYTASVYTWDTLQQTLHCLSIHLGHSAADTTLPQYTPGTLCSRHYTASVYTWDTLQQTLHCPDAA